MSEANRPTKGLLSKVVRFVTKPTTPWSELDKEPTPENPEEQYSKQMLKEVMERKRRNDFVRKLEFDQLRKIRRESNKSAGTSIDSAVSRGSTAAPEGVSASDISSLASVKPEHSTNTLEKINAIEQQMSKQWWTGDKKAEQEAVAAASAPEGTAQQPVLAAESSGAAPVAASAPAEMAPKLFDDLQVESGRFVHDVNLEEAAVMFASGDVAGTEASLLNLVQQRSGDLMGQLAVWLTLFDLYRATGNQAKFDFHAIEFASKYGRSAPVWFSMPEEVGGKAASAVESADEEPARGLNWQAPPALSASALAALHVNLKRLPPPWTFNWSRLKEVREEVVAPLLTLFRYWADQEEACIVFVGADSLLAVLEHETPIGDTAVSQDRWSLRLAALRLMGLEQDFEAAALDYCITYEVSPPSWAAPALEFTGDSNRLNTASVAPESGFLTDQQEGQKSLLTDDPQASLDGVVEGDATAQLQVFSPMVKPGRPFTVHCDRLMRIDFIAAGSVLNWVAECQQKNVLVRFSNLHRLNAVFFNLIGINEHSIIVQREN